MAKKFGIDLGTTYSCISYIDEYGKPQVVLNQENTPITPSVVAFEDGGITVVGQYAKEALKTDPDNVCSAIKRHMGEREYTFYSYGKEYSPETISAFILKKLAQDAEESVGEPVKDVVITCPAYFGLDEREATRIAGEIAGLNVLGILNEPTAAAISYGMNNNSDQTVMVYDLGGGTFDITVLKVQHGDFQVVATGGDHMLGGRDWDNALQEYAIIQYCNQTGADKDEIYDDAEVMGDIELQSENVKKHLSNRPKDTMRICGVKVEVTRQLFDQLTENLLQSTIVKMRETMAEAAKKGVTRYDKILLVGGSTRMPQVVEALKREFPNLPLEYCDPDQSVSKGASLYAQNLEDAQAPKNGSAGRLGSSKPINISNVISHSIAVKLYDEYDRPHIENQIFKNTNLPFSHELHAGTQNANQSSVLVEIYENGSSDPEVPESMCKKLTEGELGPLPAGLPAGAPIDIIFNVDMNGLLSIDVEHRPSGKKSHIEIMLQNQLSKSEIQAEINKFGTQTIQ